MGFMFQLQKTKLPLINYDLLTLFYLNLNLILQSDTQQQIKQKTCPISRTDAFQKKIQNNLFHLEFILFYKTVEH